MLCGDAAVGFNVDHGTCASSPTSRQVVLHRWVHERQALIERCRHCVGDADAEEAVARAAVTICKAISAAHPPLPDIQSISAWFVEIVHNACIDIVRERAERMELTLKSFDADSAALPNNALAPSAEDLCLAQETALQIDRVIRALPPRLRVPLMLRIERDLTYRDMALLLHDTEENLRKTIQTARRRVGQALRIAQRAGRPAAAREAEAGHDRADVERDREPPAACDSAPHGGDAGGPTAYAVDLPCAGGATRRRWLSLTTPLPPYVAVRHQSLRRYVDRHPAGWKMRLELADMLLAAGDLDAATTQYRAVLTRKPGLWDVWKRLALALLRNGRAGEACAVLARVDDAAQNDDAWAPH